MAEIHIIGDPGDIEVWLDTEAAEADGLVIGLGATRATAIADAIAELKDRLSDLRQLAARESALSPAAVDPHADSTGTPPTRA